MPVVYVYLKNVWKFVCPFSVKNYDLAGKNNRFAIIVASLKIEIALGKETRGAII